MPSYRTPFTLSAAATGLLLFGLMGVPASPTCAQSPDNGSPSGQGSQSEGASTSPVVVDVLSETNSYRASDIIGADVHNDKEEHIGNVSDLIIGKQDNILYLVLSVGGFLGIGDHLITVPYDSFTVGEGPSLILPGANEDELAKQPEYHYAGDSKKAPQSDSQRAPGDAN